MQTTPTPGLLHQLTDLLQPRVQREPQPQGTSENTPPPRKLVTPQRAVYQPVSERKAGVRPQGALPDQDGSESGPRRNVPRGTFLNIVV